MAVMAVESAVKYSFVKKGVEARRKGRYKAELTLSPRLYVKPLKTGITAVGIASFASIISFFDLLSLDFYKANLTT